MRIDLLPFGLRVHNPVDGPVHYGVDSKLMVHIWWGEERPDTVTQEFDLGEEAPPGMLPGELTLQDSLEEGELPDRIYLQYNPDGGTTWCEDRINDDDVEYMRITPKWRPSNGND